MMKLFGVAGVFLLGTAALAQDRVIPHAQDRPPGPALSPQEALEKMQVPNGFKVELFAAEPMVVNPVAMTFDSRGRVWIAESVEYPRRAPGKGKDRIKILEDTNRDGKADKETIFADGLNIPSGIVHGYGGVFVANSPDILFLKDADGDDRADSSEVLFTGFGRDDTHELPSCLTWGPDGWLYGLNGVFNPAKVTHEGKTHNFTCALWRYHPRTKAFELFCEGTSNPWGLDYDERGNFFVSACVIDHLWHLTETGYYHRQAGAYPPFTWKIESIVEHKHQKAAYCGLCYFDSAAYPNDYRRRLFMGNIHGNCINSDALEVKGASYLGKGRPDLLTANDAWFMPVVQKVGPDGCLWVVDWYDRYHCYQDANRDPAGIDRLKGRIYRITYEGTPVAPALDVAKLQDEKLLELLDHSNIYFRRWARQLLIERGGHAKGLEKIVLEGPHSPAGRIEALWTLVSQGELRPAFHQQLLEHKNPVYRAWAVRAAGQMKSPESETRKSALALAKDPDPAVRVQAAIAAGKFGGAEATPILLDILSTAHQDPSELTARIVWRNLEPRLVENSAAFVKWLDGRRLDEHPAAAELMERVVEKLLAASREDHRPLFALLDILLAEKGNDHTRAADAMATLLESAINGELETSVSAKLQERFGARFAGMARNARDPRRIPAIGLVIHASDDLGANSLAAQLIRDHELPGNSRGLLLAALVKDNDRSVADLALELLDRRAKGSADWRREVLAILSRNAAPELGAVLVEKYDAVDPDLRPQLLDVLSSRPAWTAALLDAVAKKRIPHTEVNGNQLRKILRFEDKALSDRVIAIWGTVRMERNPNREQLVGRMQRVLERGKGDPAAGLKIFEKVCAQCHKLNGKGNEVGPDLTGVGRSSMPHLLSNLLDPNLVIGKDYQARIVVTTDGQVESGLVVEESEARVVLKIAGGKLKVFPRDQIDSVQVSKVSLMPEDLEKQINDEEFRHLIAYLLSEKEGAAPAK